MKNVYADSGSLIAEERMFPSSAIYVFTRQGMAIADKISTLCSASVFMAASLKEIAGKNTQTFSRLADLLPQTFSQFRCHIFIAATGIVVRSIAPLLSSKATDPAVLVLDQNGRFVISLLSGHLGQANRLTERVAEHLGALPVITTATDTAGLPSLDLMAASCGLHIANLSAVKTLNAALLAGRQVTVYDSDDWLRVRGNAEVESFFELRDSADFCLFLPHEKASTHQMDIVTPQEAVASCNQRAPSVWVTCASPVPPENMLLLHPPALFVGVGCKKGVSAERIIAVLKDVFATWNLAFASLAGLSSFDAKQHESGLLEAVALLQSSIRFFSAECLNAYPVTAVSAQAQSVFGVRGVCEPAALAAAGDGAVLVVPKQVYGDVTVAVAYQRHARVERL